MRKTKSAILDAVHDTAKGLHQAGVMDQVTLREFDRLCLPPVEPLNPEQIKQIRETSRMSQAVFAALLNISVSKVQKWEIGQKKPAGHGTQVAATRAEEGLGGCRLNLGFTRVQLPFSAPSGRSQRVDRQTGLNLMGRA